MRKFNVRASHARRLHAEGAATEAIRTFIYLAMVWSEHADLSRCNLVSYIDDPEAITTIVKKEHITPDKLDELSNFVIGVYSFALDNRAMLRPPSPFDSDEEEAEEVNSASIAEAPSVEDAHASETAAIRRDRESSGEHSAGIST